MFQGNFVEEGAFVCDLTGWVRFGHVRLVGTENSKVSLRIWILWLFAMFGSSVFFMKCRRLEDCCYDPKLKDERQRKPLLSKLAKLRSVS